MMKILSAIAVGSLAIAALSGCSSSSQFGSCSSSLSGGSSVDQVTASSDFGTKPTVSFPKGLVATQTQAKTIVVGTGDIVTEGESVGIDAELYNGKTGEMIQETAYDGKNVPTIPVNSKLLGGFSKAIACQKVGSRVVAVIANDETLNTSLGIEKSATVVTVIDIIRANLAKANGEPQTVPDGLPRVVVSDSGVPGITVPKSSPPTQLTVALLKKGSGATVETHSNVTVHYVGVTWVNGSVPFDSSWTRNAPAQFSVDGVVTGFRDALVGQKVGSQVLAVIPPSQGYGDKATGSIPANSTLVFVIDILGTNK